MKQRQRIKNDEATMERREMTDRTLIKNRDRNDEATAERRAKSDRDLENSRDRNDEATAERRDVVDEKRNRGEISELLLLIIIALQVVILFSLI